MLASEPSVLTSLLREAFPEWREFATNCWIYRAIDELQNDFADLIDAVNDGAGLRDFIGRLRTQHPTSRGHTTQYDKRLLDVFTEGAAFAWAHNVTELGKPSFILTPGSPGIRAGDVWIEVKTIRHSREEEHLHDEVFGPALDRGGIIMRGPIALGPPPGGLLAKLQSGLDDAIRKWDRQDRTGRLVVFYAFRADFGVSPRQTAQELTAWALRAEKRTGAQVVICEGNRWQAPLYYRSANQN